MGNARVMGNARGNGCVRKTAIVAPLMRSQPVTWYTGLGCVQDKRANGALRGGRGRGNRG